MSIEYTACKQKLTISLAVFAKIKKLGFLRAGATQIFLRHFLAMKSIKKALEEKLYEDYEEAISSDGSDRCEELADMIEVIRALAKFFSLRASRTVR